MEWLVDYYQNDWPFDMVIIDELSSFKNHNSKRFKALKRIRPLIKRIIGLTRNTSTEWICRFVGSNTFIRPGGETWKIHNSL